MDTLTEWLFQIGGASFDNKRREGWEERVYLSTSFIGSIASSDSGVTLGTKSRDFLTSTATILTPKKE